jgi:tetratricopeptide (TPR) repeat protein
MRLRPLPVALVLLALVAVARAAGPEDAKAHYKKGLSYYALEKFAEAAIEYEAAFEIEPDPALLYNAAQAHRLAGNNPRALALYQSYQRLFPGQPNLKDVARHIAALKLAIESTGRARGSPPTEPIRPKPPVEPAPAVAPAPEPAPQPVPVVEPVVRRRAPEKKSTPRWVWGVVAGSVVVVGAGLGLGLGLGLTQGPAYPSPSIGTARVE